MKFYAICEAPYSETWEKFGQVIEVERRDEKIVDAINKVAEHIEGPAWVALAELDEQFSGNPDGVRAELSMYIGRLYRPGVQLCGTSHFIGPDFANVNAYWPKLWYVPENSTLAKEWEYRFEVDIVATSRTPSADVALFSVSNSFFSISRTTSVRGPHEVARREIIINATKDHTWSEAEQQHYAAALLPEWSPFLSLCVIAREVDDSLIRMLESMRGHVSEVCILFTNFKGVSRPQDSYHHMSRLRYAVDVPLIVEGYYDPDSFQQADGTWCIRNFDQARQASFELAHGMFRMFMDSDDTLEWTGKGEAPRLWDIVAKNFMQDRSVAFPYFYTGSELVDPNVPGISQPRNCIFRWEEDGKPLFRWHRPLHERCVPTEWNNATRHKNVALPGEIFIIRHHGDSLETAKSHRERNREIAAWALENRGDLSPIDRAALRFVLATIALDEEGIETAEPIYKEVIKEGASDSYGLVAAIDLSAALIAAHRAVEVPAIILPLLDVYPDDIALMLTLARAYRAQNQWYLASKWYHEVYRERPEPPAGTTYRSLYADEQYAGRLEAVEVALESKQTALADRILSTTPPAIRNRPEFMRKVHEVRRFLGDEKAAVATLTLVHYLLSLDCVDLASGVLRSVTPQLAVLPAIRRAKKAVERRTRHLRSPEEYLDTYDTLNEADLVVKSKKHQPFLLDRIMRAAPAEFWDVGCNTGWLTINVAKTFPKCRVVGIDISKARVEEAMRRARLEGVTNIEWYVDKVVPQNIAISPANSRLVLISEVLEHLEDPLEPLIFWQEHASSIMLTVPDVEAYYNLWWWARQLDESIERSERIGKEGAEHVRCYDAHELVAELKYAGFEPERIERIDISQNLVGEHEHDQSLLFVEAPRRAQSRLEFSASRAKRVDIFAEGYVPWGPRAHIEGSGEKSRMVGGSEQAVIHLMPELVKLGYEVHVYADPIERREYERGVWWHHLGEFVPSEPRDLVIVWRRAEHLLNFVREAEGRWPVWLWCHDVPDPKRAQDYRVADKVMVLSDYQKRLFMNDAKVDESRLVTLQNGVVRESIERAINQVAGRREPHTVFYGSSGDRGLLHLLRMWPTVREAVSDAHLIATYRTDLMRWPTNPPVWHRIADEIERLSSLPGVSFYPGLPHNEYLALAATCGVWAYPSNFEEISCIVAMEMQALGLEPVCTDLAALSETVLTGPLVSMKAVIAELEAGGAKSEGGTLWIPEGCFSKTFADVLIGALRCPFYPEKRAKLSQEALDRYDWTRTARLFAAAIEESDHDDEPDEDSFRRAGLTRP